jgi:hypothetical protein
MADEKICGKHDVVKENGKCWCCEQAKKQPKPAEQVGSGRISVTLK